MAWGKKEASMQGLSCTSELSLLIFRVHGKMLEAGEELTVPSGLTAARWQVVGAIIWAETPLTTPQIAQSMGISRQAVQKQVNLLLGEKLVTAISNPRSKKSPLYDLTEECLRKVEEVRQRQAVWGETLLRELPESCSGSVLDNLRQLLAGLERLSGDAT